VTGQMPWYLAQVLDRDPGRVDDAFTSDGVVESVTYPKLPFNLKIYLE